MFNEIMDYKNGIAKKVMKRDKVGHGTFDFMEPGWWALVTAAVAGACVFGHMMAKRTNIHHNIGE